MQLAGFPRLRFSHLPTPLEPLPRLTAALGGPTLFVKRDDCTGLAFGGNKVRKLEYLVADAVAGGADTLITGGGVQSNHVRQTAAAAARCGLRCELVLKRVVRRDDAEYAEGGNVQIDRLLGARLRVIDADADREAAMAAVAAEVRAAGGRPYVIPVGGSNAVGALGYVGAAFEIEQQAEQQGIIVDWVVVAASSGGTVAGLVAGFHAARSRTRVIGIEVEADRQWVEAAVRRHAAATAAHLDLDGDAGDRIDVRGGFAGPAYGEPTAGMVDAVRGVARLEGLLLDPVYSGKAMDGLIGLVASGELAKGETVVFLHTGGQPALFAYRSAFAGRE